MHKEDKLMVSITIVLAILLGRTKYVQQVLQCVQLIGTTSVIYQIDRLTLTDI